MIASRKVLVLLHCVVLSHSFNILAVFPHEGKSHQLIFAPIVRELVKKGHTLTAVAHHKFHIDSVGFQEVVLDDPDSRGKDLFTLDDWDSSIWYAQFRTYDQLLDEGLGSCEHLYANEDVVGLLKSKQKFDLILGEVFNSDCVQGFVHKFKAPLVSISTTTVIPWHNGRFGNPDNPSYIPNNHIWYGNSMDFPQRVINFLGTAYSKVIYQVYAKSNQNLLERHINEEVGDLSELVRNTSLLLVNSHWTLTFPRPFVPSVVEIGGVHIPNVNELDVIHIVEFSVAHKKELKCSTDFGGFDFLNKLRVTCK